MCLSDTRFTVGRALNPSRTVIFLPGSGVYSCQKGGIPYWFVKGCGSVALLRCVYWNRELLFFAHARARARDGEETPNSTVTVVDEPTVIAPVGGPFLTFL